MVSFRALSRKHPATFAALLSSRPDALVSKVEHIAIDLMSTGLDEPSARLVLRTSARYLMGTVMAEAAAEHQSAADDDAPSRGELDDTFKFGIAVLLDGMDTKLPSTPNACLRDPL